MHLTPDRPSTHAHMRQWWRRRWQARIVELISIFLNYQGPHGEPSVTEELMTAGDVKVALSMLYAPFDEMDLTKHYGAGPDGRYPSDVIAELELVEEHVRKNSGDITIAHSPQELQQGLAGDLPILIHAIEGGFQLGADEAEVRTHVAELARRGVAYVTVAHLFWRDVATNAPALPFLPDWLYNKVFPQPASEGLSDLGRVTVTAMLDNGVLIDITHMTERSQLETLDLLDARDPNQTVPLLATHMACRLGSYQYCLTDDVIARVAKRGGVLGLIMCKHFITDGLPGTFKTFEDSFRALKAHIDHIRSLTGSFEHIGIGTDLDGYIKPALADLEHHGRMKKLQERLATEYGPADAERISSGNALRVLQTAWQTPAP
jgi:microsomal dipeptidase-like Zn-dependent dipeptidase